MEQDNTMGKALEIQKKKNKRRKDNLNRANTSNMDGELQDFDVLTGMSDMRKNFVENGDFYPFNGDGAQEPRKVGLTIETVNNTYKDTTLDTDEFEPKSNFGLGDLLAGDIGKEKADTERIKAEAQKAAADALSKPDDSTAKLLEKIKTPSDTATDKKTGLSLGAKIGIGVAIAGVLITGIVLIVRANRKK